MHIKHKSFRAVLIALFAAVIAFAAGALIFLNTASVSVSADETKQNYYYGQLSSEAKRFYDAIADMEEKGMLKQGNAKYDLIENEVLTNAQLDSYSSEQTVMAAFGAARDAYYLDHPEVFYIDFSYLSVSVGKKDGKYVASLGTGRADTYFIKDGFKSETEVSAAVNAYNTALDKIVNEAKDKPSDSEKIKSANASLVELIDYSFCTSSSEAEYAPHIRNAYGALVNGKAVCEGFTRAFKCVMDKLGIPCVIVQGYASNEGGLEPHAWNYVKLDNSWYGVDVTWNNGTGKTESYLLRGGNAMDKEHIPDGVISAVDFKFNYPKLTSNDFGAAEDEQIKIKITDKTEYIITFHLSYDGMNSTSLAEKGLWLASRYYYNTGAADAWTDWSSVKYTLDAMSMTDGDGYSPTMINTSVMYVQFGIINRKPDTQFGTYDYDKLAETDIIASSKYIENENYGTYFGAPYIKETSPVNTGADLDVTKTHKIEITYTQNLKKIIDKEDVGINVSTLNSDTKKYIEITDVEWNGTDKVSFSFTPSAMYQHRDEVYTFTPTNLVGALSADTDPKIPMSAMFITKNNNVACNRVYPDGRLYVNTYGKPSLVGSGDLSLTGWTDDKGNPVSENQRSQLMLVATKTTEKEGKEMLDNTKLPDGAIKSAQTFEIQLNLCKNIVRIPNGSTVQVAFGFPEGYGPEDEGVTFKVYHFKRGSDGKIDYSQTDPVECIITEYGLIVNVSDFSPFAVVAVDAAKVPSVKKSVFARSVGFGGAFEGKIAQLVGEGGKATYTIKPDSGYKVAKVTLNGKDITVGSDNTVTLNYSELDERSVIEFHYVAESVAKYEADNGISVIYPCIEVTGGAPDVAGGEKGNSSNVIIIVVLAVIALLIVAAAVLLIVILKRKKHAE